MDEAQRNLLHWVVHTLEELQVPYVLAGSVALSTWAMPRATHDIDIIVSLPVERIAEFCAHFPSERFYVDPEAMRATWLQPERSMYNIIDMDTGLKVDLTPVRPNDSLHVQSIQRRVEVEILPGLRASVVSTEDLLLQKLEWYTLGGSERQLADCLNLLRAARERNPAEIDWRAVDAWTQRSGPAMQQAWERLKAAFAEVEATGAD